MITFLRLYLEVGALLLIGALAFALCLRGATRTLASEPRRWLRIGGLWLAAAFVVPAAARLATLPPPSTATVVLWAKAAAPGAGAPVTSIGWHAPAGTSRAAAVDLPQRYLTAFGWLLGTLGGGLVLRLLWRRRQLARHCAGLPVVRRCGRVVLCATDDQSSPFSTRAGGLAYIVIPTGMWADATRVRMIVAHEGCHLRRRDLQLALLLELLKIGFFWNPALQLWDRLLRQLQEIACDQVAQRRFGPVPYGRCLVWAAEQGQSKSYRLTGTRYMALDPSDDLKRRIHMLFTRPTSQKTGVALAVVATTLGMVAMAATSLTARAAVADQRIDVQAAQQLAEQIKERSGFVVPVDDWVVAKLNELVGPRREWSRQSLARLQPLRAQIERQLAAAQLPKELLAVAFAESGFDPKAAGRLGAGVWMFLADTARGYGLDVSPTRDDRLDLDKSTAAAATMLRDLHGEFADWPLAIAAYNSGPGRVLKVVKKLGSRDVAFLARTGKLGTDAQNGYTQTVLASVLLLNNPQLLD